MREKKESHEGRVLRSGEIISTKWITVLLRKGKLEVLSIPGGVEMPSFAGKSMMCMLKREVGWLLLEEKKL